MAEPERPSQPDELRRLLAAAQDWAQRTLPAPPSGHPGPECQWCPLCQFASILRGEGPVLTERVGDAGATLITALRALLDTAGGSVPSGSAGPGSSRVQHIALDDEPPSAEPPSAEPPSAEPPPARPAPSPRVQRIVLDPQPGDPA